MDRGNRFWQIKKTNRIIISGDNTKEMKSNKTVIDLILIFILFIPTIGKFWLLRECFVDRYLSFCSFSFGHCVVCSSLIYGLWVIRWYLLTLLVSLFIRFFFLFLSFFFLFSFFSFSTFLFFFCFILFFIPFFLHRFKI